MDVGTVTADDFADREGEAFTVNLDDGSTLELTLTEVEASPPGYGMPPSGRKPFSLILSGPTDVVLNQRMQSVEHPELGAADIFMVPLGPDGEAFRYQIIFS